MTMLKTLAVAFLSSAAALGVTGGIALAQMSDDKKALEKTCTRWEVVETSPNTQLSVLRKGVQQVMHCQEGFRAQLQQCSGNPNLKRFRCEPETSFK